MKKVYQMILTCNSMVIFFLIYAIKSKLQLPFFKYEWLSYILYVVSVIFLSYACLFLSKFLPDDSISGNIDEVELADGSYLPSYLGYFFVALSISDMDIATMLWIGGIIFIFTMYSQTLYFNPLFLLFGYKFYYLTMKNGMKMFIITRMSIKDIKGLHFEKLKRINDYTFIDRRRKNELRDC